VTQEIACSLERPPKTTATRILAAAGVVDAAEVSKAAESLIAPRP